MNVRLPVYFQIKVEPEVPKNRLPSNVQRFSEYIWISQKMFGSNMYMFFKAINLSQTLFRDYCAMSRVALWKRWRGDSNVAAPGPTPRKSHKLEKLRRSAAGKFRCNFPAADNPSIWYNGPQNKVDFWLDFLLFVNSQRPSNPKCFIVHCALNRYSVLCNVQRSSDTIIIHEMSVSVCASVSVLTQEPLMSQERANIKKLTKIRLN